MPNIQVRIRAPYEGGWPTRFHLPRNYGTISNSRFLINIVEIENIKLSHQINSVYEVFGQCDDYIDYRKDKINNFYNEFEIIQIVNNHRLLKFSNFRQFESKYCQFDYHIGYIIINSKIICIRLKIKKFAFRILSEAINHFI